MVNICSSERLFVPFQPPPHDIKVHFRLCLRLHGCELGSVEGHEVEDQTPVLRELESDCCPRRNWRVLLTVADQGPSLKTQWA